MWQVSILKYWEERRLDLLPSSDLALNSLIVLTLYEILAYYLDELNSISFARLSVRLLLKQLPA